MSNNQNLNNNTVAIAASADKLALLRAFLAENNISESEVKQLVKTQKTNFTYADEAAGIAICNACGAEFNTNDLPEVHADACKKSGICPHCAEQIARADALRAALKTKNISAAGTKIVVNGGKNVGVRLRQMFADAIASENFTEDMLANFLDTEYSNKTLKFASYPMLTDVTDISADEKKAEKTYYKRFYAKPYEIFGRTVKLCSQIYDAQLIACQAEFKKLGLIAETANY